jgi:hypothetical protein
LLIQCAAHGSALARLNRCGTLSSVQLCGPALNCRDSSIIDTIAPGLARGEKAHSDVFVRLFRK